MDLTDPRGAGGGASDRAAGGAQPCLLTAPVYRIAHDGVVWREAADETVVLDIATSVYYGLDRTATLLWRHLVDGADAAALVAALTATAEVEHHRASADVETFLHDLAGHGLIRRV